MSNLSKRPKYLKNAVETIIQLEQNKIHPYISVKMIRQFLGIKGDDKSAVRFYSNTLTFLEREGVLKIVSNSSPKKYAVVDESKLQSYLEA